MKSAEETLRQECEDYWLPRVPEGRSRWEYRGMGWHSAGRASWIWYSSLNRNRPPNMTPAKFETAIGASTLLYWEAVEDPALSSVTLPNYEL